jgi:hypothetical protein
VKRTLPVALAALAAAVPAPGALAQAPEPAPDPEPTLVGRAILPAEATAPAPFGAAPDAEPAPAPGAVQPVGGFSALIPAGGRTYWAMPDNGFGAKANSRSFLLRLYRVRPRFRTATGGPGTVDVLGAITLRDPDRRVPFPIVTEGTTERLLTGGDFDVESVRVDRDGDLWFGEEFGPFLLHTDATGRVLEAPFPLPGVSSPDDPLRPADRPANLPRSRGFEAMAITPNGRYLLPVLEGALTGAPNQRTRIVLEFDTEEGAYTGRRWRYLTADPGNVIGDATTLAGRRLVLIERDNAEGAAARFKRVLEVDLRRAAPGSVLPAREVLDLLRIRDPAGLSLPARAGDVGIGDPFAFPYQTVESVLPVGRGRLLLVNDTNFGSRGRSPDRPDDSDFVVVDVPGLDDGAEVP